MWGINREKIILEDVSFLYLKNYQTTNSEKKSLLYSIPSMYRKLNLKAYEMGLYIFSIPSVCTLFFFCFVQSVSTDGNAVRIRNFVPIRIPYKKIKNVGSVLVIRISISISISISS